MEDTITQKYSAEEIERAMRAQAKRVADGKASGGKRFEGKDEQARRRITAKPRYFFIRNRLGQRAAVDHLLKKFPRTQVRKMLVEWDEATGLDFC